MWGHRRRRRRWSAGRLLRVATELWAAVARWTQVKCRTSDRWLVAAQRASRVASAQVTSSGVMTWPDSQSISTAGASPAVVVDLEPHPHAERAQVPVVLVAGQGPEVPLVRRVSLVARAGNRGEVVGVRASHGQTSEVDGTIGVVGIVGAHGQRLIHRLPVAPAESLGEGRRGSALTGAVPAGGAGTPAGEWPAPGSGAG